MKEFVQFATLNGIFLVSTGVSRMAIISGFVTSNNVKNVESSLIIILGISSIKLAYDIYKKRDRY